MGGKDHDQRGELERWFDASHAEMERLRREMHDLHQPFRSQSQPSSNRETASNDNKSASEWLNNFVDRSFKTLSESFSNFPSNISELKSRMQSELDARREEERDIWRRWTGSDDSSDHIRMQAERASAEDKEEQLDAVSMLVEAAFHRNSHVPIGKIVQLFQDPENRFPGLDEFATPMLSFGGACYYKPETVENLPSTARWGWPAPKQCWLGVEWFKRDPYSPIRLEAHPDLKGSGSTWRLAFEDLLSASLDKPMVAAEKVGERVPYGRPQSTLHGPGLDWMLSLQCRGILPPQLPSIWRRFTHVSQSQPLSNFEEPFDAVLMDAATSSRDPLSRDIRALHDEIAIQAGPSTEAAPLEYEQTPWRVPETEEELYEQMPPTTAALGWPWSAPETSSNLTKDRENCESALMHANFGGDLEVASKTLKDYYDTHGEIMIPQHAPADIFLKAMENSGIPKSAMPWYGQPQPSPSGPAPRDTPREVQESVVPVTAPKPDILSQLTTTETTRAADGTVTTKVVLKQRFADGREETRESVHTAHEDASPWPPVNERERHVAEKSKQKSKGWFWS